jgi:hypothetical protein
MRQKIKQIVSTIKNGKVGRNEICKNEDTLLYIEAQKVKSELNECSDLLYKLNKKEDLLRTKSYK